MKPSIRTSVQAKGAKTAVLGASSIRRVASGNTAPFVSRRLHTLRTQAATDNGSSNGSSPQSESDAIFVAKIAAISVAGGALVKYGSLLLPLPFEPNPAIAVAFVLGPPIAYSLSLLRK